MKVSVFSRRPLLLVAAFLALSMISSSVSSLALTTTFSPTASPNFQTFSEKIVGSWVTTRKAAEPLSVEEVMRSCGGAVQGVKEVAIDEATETEFYLNRANDGFLYFPCGSYTAGPVQLVTNKDNTFLCSLQVGESSRVLIEFNVKEGHQTFGTRVFYLSKQQQALQEVPQLVLFEKPPSQFAVNDWTFELRCHMASATQPWNLQRAKWEVKSHNDDDEAVKSSLLDTTVTTTSLSFCIWVEVEQVEGGETAKTISTCLVEPSSNWAVALVRDYNESGNLVAVTQKKGILAS